MSDWTSQAVVGSRKSLRPMPGGGTRTGLDSDLTQSIKSGSLRLAGNARF